MFQARLQAIIKLSEGNSEALLLANNSLSDISTNLQLLQNMDSLDNSTFKKKLINVLDNKFFIQSNTQTRFFKFLKLLNRFFIYLKPTWRVLGNKKATVAALVNSIQDNLLDLRKKDSTRSNTNNSTITIIVKTITTTNTSQVGHYTVDNIQSATLQVRITDTMDQVASKNSIQSDTTFFYPKNEALKTDLNNNALLRKEPNDNAQQQLSSLMLLLKNLNQNENGLSNQKSLENQNIKNNATLYVINGQRG